VDQVTYARVLDRIAAASTRSGRQPDEVTLVVVSKGRSDGEVLDVHRQGHRVFAENREQGLRERIESDLPDDIVWHFVGPLQRRKVPYVGSHVRLLHSMDRFELADRWVRRGDVPVLAQFNLGAEPQKSGFAPADAEEVLDGLLGRGLDVVGVMAIPPMSDDPEDARPWFAMLRSIYDSYRGVHPAVSVCSMGMTNDFEVAIEEGATMVRIGRAIFSGEN
jgi:pyridoxal phosphate enzyme (YggS family)